MSKITPPQARALLTCDAEGSLIVGGIDQTPDIRKVVIFRLSKLGLLKYKAPKSLFEESEWVLTDAGQMAVRILKGLAR